MIDDVDERLTQMVGSHATLSNIALHETFVDAAHAWEAGWTIQTDRIVPVTIIVKDEAPTMVYLRLEDRLVPMGVPPWIERRGEPGFDSTGDRELREVFRDRLVSTVALLCEIIALAQ